MINSILKNFELIASAQTLKTQGRGIKADNRRLYGIEKLRELILDLALRGKLVPQYQNDESLERLIKTKINFLKDEVPYEIPEKWRWVKLRDITILENGDRSKNYPNKSKYVSQGIPFINAGHLNKGNISMEDMNFISEVTYDKLGSGKVQECDILFCLRGSLGKSAIVEKIGKGAIASSLVIVRVLKPIFEKFIQRYFDSPLSYSMISKYDNGTAQPNLSAGDLSKFLIPIPPPAEQYRIVAKVDELMALCDQLEKEQTESNTSHETLVETLLDTLTSASGSAELESAWQRISDHFELLFTTEYSIDRLKQTILQLAVMGKLVEQDPNDEPASELLKRIKKEKERLVKEGKIKNQNHLDEIGEEEMPFELPKGWEFVRLGNIASKIGSGSTPKGSNYESSGVIFLRSQNVWNEGLEINDVTYISEHMHQKMFNTVVYPNDILLNITGASLGRSAIFPEDLKEANVSQHVTIIRPIDHETRFYLHLCILSPYFQKLVWERQVGMAREGLSKKVLEQFEIPFPPLAEQKRIVDKVYKLFGICDRLKERIRDAQGIERDLVEAIANGR